MASVSSEEDHSDHRSEQFGNYSPSADVSESESSTAFSIETLMPSNPLTYLPLARQELLDSEIPAHPQIMLPVVVPAEKPVTTELSEIELMKERFAKLLLGEDMSGGGKGVCTALAISNAITYLSATVFGELWKLEPLAQQKKSMWLREMEWLLCVSDSIVELIPSLQEFPGGGTFEVMVTRPRLDLYINLPALKKLDGMLLRMLDGFCESEFHYVDRDIVVDSGEHIEAHPWSPSSMRRSIRLEEKWWLPFPKVPPSGLSEDTRKRLQQFRENAIQIFKAAVAINNSVLLEMDIPNVYSKSLPKEIREPCIRLLSHPVTYIMAIELICEALILEDVSSVKACLGETLYRYITADQFSPECLLEYLEMSSEYTTLEIANRIEASMHIWRHKYFKQHLKHAKSGRLWGGKVKGKSKVLEQRTEILLRNLKLQFPGLPQTALDIQKIQYNKDVGQSILESYSRVIESLAFNLMARIDDLQYVDDAAKQHAAAVSLPIPGRREFTASLPLKKHISPSALPVHSTPLHSTPCAFSLSGPAHCSSTAVGSPNWSSSK